MANTTQTVLVVEDEQSIVKVLTDKLEEEGFSVLHAKNGEEGLNLATTKKPDIILLDIIMPKMDGISMLRALRETVEGKDIPVIILTNLSDGSPELDPDDPAIAEYLVKTDWSLDDVITKVRGRLGK